MSLEIRPLAALYSSPPHTKNVLYKAFSGRRGWYAHAYGNCDPFYCNSLKNIYGGGGYNAARGLISRDIATDIVVQKVESIDES